MAVLKIWNYTWEECVGMYEQNRTPLVTWEGYLIGSRDRKLEPKKGYEMYRATLALAFKKGKEIPKRVIESEPELFGRLIGIEETSTENPPAPVGRDHEETPQIPVDAVSAQSEKVDGQSSLFAEHLSWLDCR